MKNKSSFHLQINAEKEVVKIVRFLRNVMKKTGKKNIVIGWSGGIDSTVCLYLSVKAIGPKNVFVYHLPYIKNYWKELVILSDNLKIPKNNSQKITVKKLVDEIGKLIKNSQGRIRLGNVMARIRMIILFDQAKFRNALVCGTENRTENLLGYFTRFGDSASDIEPISHLFKTQVYQLAAYLKIEKNILKRIPTADLWKNQSDEGEFGFTYKEADEVLYRFVDKSMQIKQIKLEGFENAEKIISRNRQNRFKQIVPYILR